jgi:cbb3-type cytochrome oxidase subunit 3
MLALNLLGGKEIAVYIVVIVIVVIAVIWYAMRSGRRA